MRRRATGHAAADGGADVHAEAGLRVTLVLPDAHLQGMSREVSLGKGEGGVWPLAHAVFFENKTLLRLYCEAPTVEQVGAHHPGLGGGVCAGPVMDPTGPAPRHSLPVPREGSLGVRLSTTS